MSEGLSAAEKKVVKDECKVMAMIAEVLISKSMDSFLKGGNVPHNVTDEDFKKLLVDVYTLQELLKVKLSVSVKGIGRHFSSDMKRCLAEARLMISDINFNYFQIADGTKLCDSVRALTTVIVDHMNHICFELFKDLENEDVSDD